MNFERNGQSCSERTRDEPIFPFVYFYGPVVRLEENQTPEVHFVKTAKQFAFEKCILVLACVVVIACFSGVVLFVNDLPVLVWIACGFVWLIGGAMVVKIIREIRVRTH